MNSIKMTGRLTREPDLKHIGTRKRAVCEMRLAVYNGRYSPTFISLSVFDGPAYVAAEHLTKGSRVKVEGELRFNERTKTGARRFEPHSVVGRVEPLGRPPEQKAEAVKQVDSQPAGAAEPAPA
jgi:single-stranded DNA-binding protein